MIKKALKEMTVVSENEDDNLENYLAALDHIDNIYKFVTVLENEQVQMEKIKFLPSFIDIRLAERLGILTDDDQNELRCFKLQSETFIKDQQTTSKLKIHCTPLCRCIVQKNDVITFTLKQ